MTRTKQTRTEATDPYCLPPRVSLGVLLGAGLLALSNASCSPANIDPVGENPSGAGGSTTNNGSGGSGEGGSGVGGSGVGGSGEGGSGEGGSGAGGSADGGSGGSTIVKPPVPPSECDASTPGSRLLRRLTRRELTNTQIVAFGSAATDAPTKLPGDAIDRIRLSNDASILGMTQDTAQALLDRAEEIATAVTAAGSLESNLPCAATSPDATCASEFIDKYGQALFRRPLSDTESSRYLGLHDSVMAQSDFATGLQWTLVALQQSPHAVYRSELGTDGILTPYEIASELAYNYSAHPPTSELLALAISGELDDPATRFEQAKALLQTEGGKEVVQQFFSEWLSYRDVLTVSRANTPDNFETVRPKMVQETERFVETLLYDKAGTLADLLTADFTVGDQELAGYYGFSGGSADINNDGGQEIARAWGLGVFAQGSVTTAMASITITSPTRRGLLLLRRLYCTVPGLPEGVNFDLTDGQVQGNTTRERLELSHLEGSCQSCHAIFDPLGFGFEHIDHVGRFREEEVTPNGNFPIDATAVVATLDDLEIDGQEELMLGLAGDADVLSCVSGTLSRYVYGAEGNCRDKEAREKAMTGEASIVDYLADLAREPHFVQRSN